MRIKFDQYVLIFSYNAYKLEKELHHYFDKYKITKVNLYKEFSKVSIGETKKEELSVDFEVNTEAEEFYQTHVAIKNKSNLNI